jgi:hypothetical protein
MISFIQSIEKFLYDGPVMVSTGQRVTEWTARQAIDVNEAKL